MDPTTDQSKSNPIEAGSTPAGAAHHLPSAAGAPGAPAPSSTDCNAPTVVATPRPAIRVDAKDADTLGMGLGDLEPGDSGAADAQLPQIPGYRIRRVLGRGGMGVVYEAIQLDLSRPVALKLLPAFVAGAHRDMLMRFRREAAAAARLHHTHIIPIYHFGESAEGAYYTMELVEGLPLDKVIRRLAPLDVHAATSIELAEALRTSPEEGTGAERRSSGTQCETTDSAPFRRSMSRRGAARGSGSGGSSGATGSKGREYYRHVARWMSDAADALHYAHTQGIIHRDVKPSNLMLSRDGGIMVCDFGLAKAEGDHSVTQTGALVGTYRYLSPEQIGAKRITVDARSDVYSLGATMYELLTFTPVFPSVQQSELLSQILFKEPTPPRRVIPTVPVDLQTICLKALEKSPTARYQSARELADDLRAYLGDNAIRARPDTPWRRIAKFVRRRRTETLAVTSVLLVAVIAGAVIDHYHVQRVASERERRATQLEMEQQRLEGLRKSLRDEGISAWGKSDHDTAKAAFDKILQMFPDDYAALVNLGNVCKDAYWRTCDPNELRRATVLLSRAAEVKPDGRDALNALGVVCQANGDPLRAIEQFNRALAIDKDFFAPYVNLAVAFAVTRDFAQAEDMARRGFELCKTRESVMPLRIYVALLLHNERPDAWERLALARQMSRNRDPAIQVLSALCELRIGTPEADRRAVEYAGAAHSLIEGTVTQGCPVSPTPARCLRVLAQARLATGDYSGAARAADDALVAQDVPVIAHLLHAIADVRMNRTDDARKHLADAQAAWPPWADGEDDFVVQDGNNLWFDSPAEVRALRQQVVDALAAAGAAGP